MIALAVEAGSAQISPNQENVVRGVVINSVTREPVGRALVYSADRRFATLTDDQGHFQFEVPPESPAPDTNTTVEVETRTMEGSNSVGSFGSSFPSVLLARKPGFLSTDKARTPWDMAIVAPGQDVTIALVPEARVVGRVVLPSSNAADRIVVHLYQRRVIDGRAHWETRSNIAARSTGEFRFAGLEAGTYKVFTGELMDRDPLTFNPVGPVYGYPPSYFPDASNFQAAAEIHLAAGMTFQADLSPVRQPYYNVKLPITNAPGNEEVLVSVATQGKKGPGFELGYNPRDQRVEGSLPNGTYLVEAVSEGPKGGTASGTVTVKGAPVESPSLTMVPNGSVHIETNLELTQDQRTRGTPGASPMPELPIDATLLPGGNFFVEFESADEFTPQRLSIGPQSESREGNTITYGSVAPGRYWLKVRTHSGFAASMKSGDVDLLRAPLTVHAGANLRVNVNFRNDGAEISGSIEGAKQEKMGVSATSSVARGFLYCIPLPDSPGQFRETPIGVSGNFHLEQLPPGSYRLLAFDQPQTDVEFLNPEAMRVFENKGQVVRLAPGQKEHVTLQVIPSNE